MKTPTKVFGHQLALAQGLDLTPSSLNEGLRVMKEQKYAGMVVVPAAFNSELTAERAVDIAGQHNMSLLACGFLSGSKFNPLSESGITASAEEVLRQAEYQRVFRNAGIGGNVMCGPIDQGWGLIDSYDPDSYQTWIARLDQLAKAAGLRFVIEPLNKVESGVPSPFRTLLKAINEVGASNLGLQYDTGHAKLQGVTFEEFLAMVQAIEMFEFANLGRWPLSAVVENGIDFGEYVAAFDRLPEGCIVAVEPFDPQGVIIPLGLEKLCPTNVPGIEALQRDSDYLIKAGVLV